jgi:hypothetical protein
LISQAQENFALMLFILAKDEKPLEANIQIKFFDLG